MRVVFVDNLLIEQYDGQYSFDLQPHMGLISLVAIVEGAGHDGVVYDPKAELASGALALDASLYRRMAERIVELSPDVVGFTSLGCNFICTVKVAGHVRRMCPRIPLLLGGPHASILDRQILCRWPQFDIVVRGEAEAMIVRVLDASIARDFAAVPGVTYRSGAQIIATEPPPLIADLDTLPWAAYDHHPVERLGLTTLRVEAGRGCPFSCTFCSTASFFGRRYRLKSAGRLCAELDHLNERYGVTDFALMHDLFTVNKAKVREFCDAVGDRGYTWKCSARMDCVTPDLLEQMSAAGCTSIYYGVETGSPRMQAVVRKRLDLSLVLPTLERTHGIGMRATASFITGYPQERQDDQDETLDLAGSLFYECPDHLMVQLHLLTPEPGTGLISDYGDALQYDGHISDFNFPTLEPDDADAMRRDPEVFMNHHFYPSEVPRLRHVLATSVFRALYKLGFAIMRHLLDCYERRLSLLVAHMVEWAREHDDHGPYDGEFVYRFVEGTRGPEHHLTSLVRYMLAADVLRPAATTVDGAGDTELWALSPAAALLRDLHDCPAILSAIGADDPIAPAVSARRSHYLLLLDRRAERTVRNFELDDASLAMLEQFRRPRSLEDGGNALPDPETFEHLFSLGVLCGVQGGSDGG